MNVFLEAARRIVEAEKKLWPGCEEATCFDFGGSSSTQDSKFQRLGTSGNVVNYDIPQFLQDLITNNANSAIADPSIGPEENTFLRSLFAKTPASIPGAATLDSNMAIAPTTFTGSSTLSSIAARDPYSSQFETSTQAAYEQRASDAMAQVATGPDAVRGGQARTGVMQGVAADRLAQGRGQEVRNAQLQDAGIVEQAGQLFNTIEGQRRGTQLQAQGQKGGQSLGQDQNALGAAKTVDQRKLSNLMALQLASDLLGSKKGTTTDNLIGSGSQTNEGFNWGVNLLGGCCFIFLESLNGKLPWYIERARHDYYTGHRRHGYKWMANWLVPQMRHSALVASAVNKFLVLPFLRYGRWLYHDVGARWRDCAWGPYCELWLALWSVLGALFCNRKVD